MATCGRSCTLSITGANNTNVSVFNISLNATGNETDITALGSGEYGDWITCTKAGELVVDSYTYIGDVDSMTAYSLTIGSDTFSGSCVGRDFNATVDAKGVAQFSYTLRLTGDISVT